MIDAPERNDVVVVAAVADLHVAIADRTGVRRVEAPPVPPGHAHLDPAMAEAAHWYDVAGGVSHGRGRPKGGGLDRLGAVLDPVAPQSVIFHVLIRAPWPVLGAPAGSWRYGAAERAAVETTMTPE